MFLFRPANRLKGRLVPEFDFELFGVLLGDEVGGLVPNLPIVEFVTGFEGCLDKFRVPLLEICQVVRYGLL